jgi:hypothetical protein
MAGYNQLAQLQSADTQNQLAQMQMQEARQLAPLRLQEQQSRAATAKLTLDEANEAQTYIKSVMTEAANASGGSAPTDPFEAAKQMMNYPNSQVQAAGLRLLESSQKLKAYEQQTQFLKDEGGAAVAPAGFPAVTASGSVNDVKAPMTVPSVMPGGYSYQKDVTNALASAVAAAPAANALISTVASALQNADALKKEIEKGDRTYGKAPGWTSKRELLVEAYKQALKPGAVGTKSEFERLLDESGLSDTEKQDMRKAKLAKETAKASDRPEVKSEFEKLLAESGLTDDQKQEMRKAKLAKETAKPAEKKNEFEQLLEDSGLSDTEKQDMRKAKLAKETAKPADKPETKSEFEKLLAESGLTEDEKQAMRKAKLTKETTAPTAQAERKTDLARLMSERAALVASGVALTDNRVVAYDNAITKASAPSAGQPSELTRLIAERDAAKVKGASQQVLASYDAAINKQINFAPPMQVVMPVAIQDPKDPTKTIYVDRKDAVGKTPAVEVTKPLTALQAQKLKTEKAADTAHVSTSQSTADELEKLTNELVGSEDGKIKPHPGLGGITGFAAYLPNLPKGDARQAQQKLDTFKGKILALGRGMASQDGKLGNMAVQEWKFVSDAVQAIDPKAGNLAEQMRDVVRQAKAFAARQKSKFESTYEDTGAAAPAAGRGVDTNNPLLK